MRLHITVSTPQILGDSRSREGMKSDLQDQSEIRLFHLLRYRLHHLQLRQLQLLQWLLLLLQLLQQYEELFRSHRMREVLLSVVLQSE